MCCFFARFPMLNAQLAHTHELFSYHPQVRQREQRGQLSRIFHQSTKAHFHVTELAFDHPKRMLDLGSCLGFAVLNLALDLVKHAVLIQRGIGAAARRYLPDDLSIFMLFALLGTGVSGVCIDSVFFAMQEFGNLCDIGHIGGGTVDMMNQSGLNIGAI